MVYGKLCILKVVVPCEETWPLEKVMIFHEVDFEQNKYEFYLDMLDTPRIWGYGVLSDAKEVVYEIGDRACLRVSPLRGDKLFGVKGKLAPRFVGPYRVLERMGEVANKLESPEGLSGVHDVFHVSQLKKCHAEMANIPL